VSLLGSVLGFMVVGRGPRSQDVLARAQLLVVFVSQLHNTALSVQLLPDSLICSDELIDLSSQLIVLVAHNTDVIIHRVNLNLQVGV